MDLILAFCIFLSGVILCMVFQLELGWAMLLGFFCFFGVGLRRGYPEKELLGMAKEGGKTAFLVLRVILLIGVLTSTWRASGTIAFFVSTGLRWITPERFVLVAFLLPAVLSLACGSSFGTAGTAGVILMTIARSGGANLAVTAGAAMSGAYIGERLSPASSAAALVCAVTGVNQQDFHKRMWRDSVIPLLMTLVIYGGLSIVFPIEQVDVEMLQAMEERFVLNWLAALPALVLLILPWLKFSAMQAIAISCLIAVPVAIFVQGISPLELLKAGVFGYQETHPMLADILSGGGLLSMSSTVVIVFLSCAYASIFTGTGMLNPIQQRAERMTQSCGRIGAHILVGLCAVSLLCNQVGSIVMNHQIMAPFYEKKGWSKEELARDIGNTVLVLAGVVPWCIACSVPLAMMGSGAEGIPYSVFLHILPLTAFFYYRGRTRGGRRLMRSEKKGTNVKMSWMIKIGAGVLAIGLLSGYGVCKFLFPQTEEIRKPVSDTETETVRVDLPEQKPDSIYTFAPPAPVEEPEEKTSYDFGKPVPEREPVDNSYFEDAVFIGDSRTDGFMLFSGVGCGENLTSNGLSIFKLEEKRVFRIDGEKYTLGEALDRKQYGKIYISLGVNELGYRNDEGFYQAYLEVIDFIRARQPDAVFYIQGLIPVNEEVVASVGGPEYFENGHLKVYNELMQKAAMEKNVAFLDLYSEFADENGSLPKDASQDGIHLGTSYCKRWLNYLQRHTVEPEIFDVLEEPDEEMKA